MLTNKGYVQKRPKYEPTDRYFYLSRQLDKWMMRDNDSNSHVDPVITEMDVTQQIPILHVCDLGERRSKMILAKKN